MLHVQLSEVGAAGEEDGQLRGQGEASKYGNTVAWCQDVQQLLGVLSGVTVLRIEEDCVAVRLLTSFHSTWEALGVCSNTYCNACLCYRRSCCRAFKTMEPSWLCRLFFQAFRDSESGSLCATACAACIAPGA